MQYSLRTFLIVATLFGVLLVAGIWAYRGIYYGIDDGYAQCGAAQMLINYMDSHDGDWPPDWESLRQQFDAGKSRISGWSFAKYRSRIWIDFEADPQNLRQIAISSDTATFDVVGATHYTGVYVGDNPNKILWNYFRESGEK